MRKLLLVLSVLVIIATLLSGCAVGRPKQELPSRPVEISKELADRAWGKIHKAQQQESFHLTFTESELTSLLVFTLEERFKEHPLRDPRIWIERNKVIFAATIVNLAPVALNLVVEFQPYVQDGTVKVQFTRALINNRPLPAITLRTVSRIVSETLAEAALKVYFEEIRLDPGIITIKGRTTF